MNKLSFMYEYKFKFKFKLRFYVLCMYVLKRKKKFYSRIWGKFKVCESISKLSKSSNGPHLRSRSYVDGRGVTGLL